MDFSLAQRINPTISQLRLAYGAGLLKPKQMENETMTRKDYVRFAAMFKDMLIDCGTNASKAAIVEVSIRASNIFAADNARFDRARFLKACGVKL